MDERRLTRLLEVGRGLVAELDLDAVLTRVLQVARDLTGARYAALGVVNEDRNGLERFVYLGIDEATRQAIGDLPRGHGILGELIREPKPLRLRDVGEHPRSYGFPPAHPHMETFLGVPILIRGEAWGNLYLSEKEGGGEFTEDDEEAIVTLADWAAIAIDNARLYRAAEERREGLERAVRRLRVTAEIARAVGGETDLARVLELIAKRARALVEATSVGILLLHRDRLVIEALAGDVDREILGRDIPVEGSVSGDVLRSGRPQRIADVSSREMPYRTVIGGEARSAMVVPLVFRGAALGVLIAVDRLVDGPEFDAGDEELTLAFGAIAATAVHTAQSVAEERLRHAIAAAEQERRRWARELHDETLQALAGLRVLLSSALQRSGDALERAAREAVQQIDTEMDGLRRLITELRPAALDELGLEPALEHLAERTRASEGLVVETAFEADGRLAPELESTIYRVVQEALTNAAKHAEAERVEIRVSRRPDGVEVVVRDDGLGFDPTAASGGFGLTGMRERVELAGGRLEIDSSETGTIVRALLPAGAV